MKVVYLIALITIFLQSQSRIILWPLIAAALADRYAENDFKLCGFVFILGILADLVSGRLLGETSIFLLLLVLLVRYLNQRFKQSLKISFGAAAVFEIIYIVLVNTAHF